MPLLILGLATAGCPRSTATFCYPGDEISGCAGTAYDERTWTEELPDGDGTCPAGVYLYCPDVAAGVEATSRQVMEAACEHAYDHDWDDCSVRYLCGPVESESCCCYLVEVVDPVNS